MPGAEKMHRIEEIKVTLGSGKAARTFVVPAALGARVEKLLTDQAGKDQSVPAEAVFPELADEATRAASMLRGSRHKAEMTQKELASALGVKQHHLSEMENGKRPIGKAMAKRLASVLDCDYRLFV